MDIQEVKNCILKNNPSGKFRFNARNLEKMLKIGTAELRTHLKQMMNDGFIQLIDDKAIIVNNEGLKVVRKKVIKNAILCAHCNNCLNRRYFNSYIDGIKHNNVSCYCKIREQAITVKEMCRDFKQKKSL